MKQVKSIEKEKEENNKTNQERERGVNKKYIDNIQNICDAVRKQISFNEKIRRQTRGGRPLPAYRAG